MAPTVSRHLLTVALIASLSRSAAVLALPGHTQTAAHTGRSLQQATTSLAITVRIQEDCTDPDAWVALSTKNSAGYRGECGTASGGTLPCLAVDSTGSNKLNYSVNQGESLAVSFNGTASYVFLGGALNDGFLNSDGCYLRTTTAATTTSNNNSITAVSDTGFVFSPTGAVCSQFYNNTIGTLTVLAFDTSYATYGASGYSAAACKFEVGIIIVPDPQSTLSQNQLFPLTDAASALTGSLLQVLGIALLGAISLLAMLH